VSKEKCQRPNCSGTIVDAICEDCGRPALGQSLLASPAAKAVAASSPASSKIPSSYLSSRVNTATGKTSRRHTSSGSQRSTSRRRALGGGLVSLPDMPVQDPLKLLMAKAEVPAKKRRCPGCDQKVSRTKGFCSSCGQEYNFEPSLKAGDLVNGKFEIKGPIAFGGLGWIYLAFDKFLSRWVILKGLLNAKDEASAAAAVAERQYLAAVKFPKIVAIYDFVNHGAEGLIVMEYVGGRTLETLRKDLDIVDLLDEHDNIVKRGVNRSDLTALESNMTVKVTKKGLFPVEEAIAYILGILPAFAYLHSHNMVYCDFKPDNFMLEGSDVKLIDMGGVRRIGDVDGDIYGTRGYMAPEASDDPVATSDLYTVGRALANMVMDFPYLTDNENSLPTPAEQPVLAENEAFYRFLLRATHPDQDERFQTADEMSDQLYGVLREMVALKSDPKPADSKAFSSDNLLHIEDESGMRFPLARVLPTMRVNPDDIAADDVLRLGSLTQPDQKIDALRKLVSKKPKSVEARLRLADTLIALGAVPVKNKVPPNMTEALAILSELEQEDPFDWRVQWEKGLAALVSEDFSAAHGYFDKVYFEMPGELAPKLALAFAAEAGKDWTIAKNFYDRVSRVDPNQVSACFGLARVEAAQKRLIEAAHALERVPATHSLGQQSRIAVAELLLEDETTLTPELLRKAEEALNTVGAEEGVVHELTAKLMAGALSLIKGGAFKIGQGLVRGIPMDVKALRFAAETEYRNTARYVKTPEEKVFWVDLANKIRPITLF